MLSEIKSSCLWTHCPLCQKYFPALNAANSFSSFRSHIRSHLFIMSFLTTQTLTHPFISALWFCLTWYNKQNLYVYYRKVEAHRKVVRQSWWSLIYPSTRFNTVPLLSLPFYGWALLSTGFPGGSAVKHPPAVQGLQLQSRGDPWRRARQPSIPENIGEAHGQRSLAGYSPQACKESDTTEAT